MATVQRFRLEGVHYTKTLMHNYLSILSDSKHGLFPSDDLHRTELREALAQPGDFDLVAFHPAQLAPVVVPPTKYGEGVAQGDVPVLGVPVQAPSKKNQLPIVRSLSFAL